MVDANSGMTRPAQSSSGVRPNGLADVRLAAGEGEFTAAGFPPLLQKQLLDVVQIDIARCGGFTAPHAS